MAALDIKSWYFY